MQTKQKISTILAPLATEPVEAPASGSGGLRHDGFQPIALAGRRLTAELAQLVPKGPNVIGLRVSVTQLEARLYEPLTRQ